MSGELVVGIVASIVAGLSLLAAVAAILVSWRATLQVVAEERRARIDASAPRVVVRDLREHWPPVIPGMGATVSDLSPTQVFNMSGDAKREILLVCHAELVNEGQTTAFVALPPGCVRVDQPDQEPATGTPEWLALANGRPSDLMLSPGGSEWVRMRVGQLTVEEWTRRVLATDGDGRVVVSVQFTIKDQFVDGVEDTIVVDVRAKPLAQSPHNPNTWMLSTPVGMQPFVDIIKASTRRTIRRYPGHA